MGSKLILYYDSKASYSHEIPDIVLLMESLRSKHGIEFEEIPRHKMTSESEGNLKRSIYELQLRPTTRGDIVTSRGNMLPLSKSKNLNLPNTPILLIEEDGRAVDILPKRLQDHFTDVKDGLVEMLENDISHGKNEASAEDVAISNVMNNPQLIEDSLVILGRELDVSPGKVDLLGLDSKQKYLVMEFERAAEDKALGQIIRLWASFAHAKKLPPEVIRKMIVCNRISIHHKEAAESVGIEVKVLPEIFSQMKTLEDSASPTTIS